MFSAWYRRYKEYLHGDSRLMPEGTRHSSSQQDTAQTSTSGGDHSLGCVTLSSRHSAGPWRNNLLSSAPVLLAGRQQTAGFSAVLYIISVRLSSFCFGILILPNVYRPLLLRYNKTRTSMSRYSGSQHALHKEQGSLKLISV